MLAFLKYGLNNFVCIKALCCNDRSEKGVMLITRPKSKLLVQGKLLYIIMHSDVYSYVCLYHAEMCLMQKFPERVFLSLYYMYVTCLIIQNTGVLLSLNVEF